ncbi:putative albumin I chain a [Medicago truncatula]|uniref:Nodule Cysteine-Rich (NCR) secreted peptide n=1 Tax=Medicago truncatula TaxID=3880 RepID=A0A072TXA9_MEDTR|nr:albumin-1 [Medicago truncatula]KEH22072.1 Nodule Cysteine-Rich (NCR) secreted peptide [Medicago truncatula]RHN45029.1 putative albumin I chain a [Medicago truncatula]
MTYVKHAPLALAVFLLATLIMFPVKKVEAHHCSIGPCSTPWATCGSEYCICIPMGSSNICQPSSYKDVVKITGKNHNFCQSHVECKEKGRGSFCARYPSSKVDYGRCVASISEEEDFLRMSVIV